jgi:hypothetical protein
MTLETLALLYGAVNVAVKKAAFAVAIKTHVGLLVNKKALGVAFVRIVAAPAHSYFVGSVQSFVLHFAHFMTVAAQVGKVLDQKPFGAGGMWLVAYRTYAGQNRGVYNPSFSVCLLFMTRVAHFRLRLDQQFFVA